MPIVEITTALGAIKATTDMIGGVLAADKALEQSELKFKLAEAATSLLSATRAVHAAEDAIKARDAEIASLNEALEIKATVKRHKAAYYELNEDGEPVGDPYCMRCWQDDHKLRNLASGRGYDSKCPSCGASFPHMSAHTIYREPKQA